MRIAILIPMPGVLSTALSRDVEVTFAVAASNRDRPRMIAMTASKWHLITGVDPARLREARLQAHYAAQWLARAARAYVAPRPNDEHTNLGWDDAPCGLVTHAFNGGGWLGLRLADLRLTFVSKAGERCQELALDGRTDSEVRAWLGGHLSATAMDAWALDRPSPYEIPEHAIARG